MEPLRMVRRSAVQQLFRELRGSNAPQALGRQRRFIQALQETRASGQSYYSTASSRQIPRNNTLRSATRPKTPQHIFSRNSRSYKQGSRQYSNASSSSSTSSSSESNLSFSGRMKKLSREYGWSALGVYLLLSALDFPFCFLAVRSFGTERIGYWEHVAVGYIKDLLKWPMTQLGWEQGEEAVEEGGRETTRVVGEGLKEVEQIQNGKKETTVKVEGKRILDAEDPKKTEAEAESPKKGEPSIWTQLALAYAIHKSFIFFRVPLTAAVTPKVVKTLRGWGWDIGKSTKKAMKTKNTPTPGTGGTGISADKGTGINTGGSKKAP